MLTPTTSTHSPAALPSQPLKQRAFVAASALLLAACAGYEPPKPGVHRAPGDPQPEVVCITEAPTTTRFVSTRCVTRSDMNDRGANDRDTADAIRTPPPDIR